MESRTAKIFLFLTVVSAMIWLGGVNVRILIGLDLLEFGTIEFKSNIHPTVERAVFSLIAKSSVVTLIAYVMTIVSSVLFLKTTRIPVRRNGWLVMSAILLYIFMPVEVYTMVLDAQMVYLDLVVSSSDLVEFRQLFIHRVAALSGVPIIALMCYHTIIPLLIFRPMSKTTLSPVSR